jgi:hypothetical protein
MINDSHIYERNLVGDDALVMPAGVEKMCFAIDFPHAADITKVIAKQISGVATGFTLNLYNRQVCALAPGSLSSSAMPSTVSDEIAKVIPTQEQHIPGQAIELFHPDGYAFKNMEGTFTVPIKKIYLELILDDFADASVWEIAIACHPKF